MDLSRSELLLGEQSTEKLAKSKVLLLGLGGVGSFCFEALVRSGVGEIHAVDGDTFNPSNINRQLLAEFNNCGEEKTAAAIRRARIINPECRVVPYPVFLQADTLEKIIDLSQFDYIIDAIDTISVKIRLAVICYQNGYKLISCMAAGNRLDPTAFKVGDLFETLGCPLCSVMRRELKRSGVQSLKVVYSCEPAKVAVQALHEQQKNDARRLKVIGSVSFVPPVAGLLLASEVIKSLI